MPWLLIAWHLVTMPHPISLYVGEGLVHLIETLLHHGPSYLSRGGDRTVFLRDLLPLLIHQ
jgi:hypothetical protein